MRIGIITYSWANNYGALLQALALQTVLIRRSVDAFILPIAVGSSQNLLSRWIGKTLHSTICKLRRNRVEKKMDSFRRRNFKHAGVSPQTCKCFNRQLPEADAYIVGSDQVWNIRTNGDKDCRELFFLKNSFGVRRYAYAASFGIQTLSSQEALWIKDCLSKFDGLSVREESGVQILRSLGMPSKWVPDPTALLSAQEWRDIFGLRVCAKKKVFLYRLPWRTEQNLEKVAVEIARRKGLAVESSYPQGTRVFGPEEWVSAIASSRLVVTNSFHGVMFSIRFHIPFVVSLITGEHSGMNERLYSILGKVGLEDRILRSGQNAEVVCDRNIDWMAVDMRLEEWCKEGFAYLDSIVKGLAHD